MKRDHFEVVTVFPTTNCKSYHLSSVLNLTSESCRLNTLATQIGSFKLEVMLFDLHKMLSVRGRYSLLYLVIRKITISYFYNIGQSLSNFLPSSVVGTRIPVVDSRQNGPTGSLFHLRCYRACKYYIISLFVAKHYLLQSSHYLGLLHSQLNL